jgi:hypothetical protein
MSQYLRFHESFHKDLENALSGRKLDTVHALWMLKAQSGALSTS